MKKITLFTLLFILFCFVFLMVSCEKKPEDDSMIQGLTDWIQYGTDKDGSTWSYNRNLNVKKDGDNYTVNAWAKRVLSDKGKERVIQEMKGKGKSIEGYDKLSEDRILNEVDCKKQRFKILTVVRYDTDGKILLSENVNQSEWQYVAPKSNGSIFLRKVCPGQK